MSEYDLEGRTLFAELKKAPLVVCSKAMLDYGRDKKRH